jgi:hypothetical protein
MTFEDIDVFVILRGENRVCHPRRLIHRIQVELMLFALYTVVGHSWLTTRATRQLLREIRNARRHHGLALIRIKYHVSFRFEELRIYTESVPCSLLLQHSGRLLVEILTARVESLVISCLVSRLAPGLADFTFLENEVLVDFLLSLLLLIQSVMCHCTFPRVIIDRTALYSYHLVLTMLETLLRCWHHMVSFLDQRKSFWHHLVL